MRSQLNEARGSTSRLSLSPIPTCHGIRPNYACSSKHTIEYEWEVQYVQTRALDTQGRDTEALGRGN